jgi:hypothetical protein
MSALKRIERCELIDLPKIADSRGNLTFVEGGEQVPFGIERVYYLYDVPGGAERGGHAHKELEQLLIAMSGSFDVVVDDGYGRERVHLSRAYYGLYVDRSLWLHMPHRPSLVRRPTVSEKAKGKMKEATGAITGDEDKKAEG